MFLTRPIVLFSIITALYPEQQGFSHQAYGHEMSSGMNSQGSPGTPTTATAHYYPHSQPNQPQPNSPQTATAQAHSQLPYEDRTGVSGYGRPADPSQYSPQQPSQHHVRRLFFCLF